jgi:hypothetical protein
MAATRTDPGNRSVAELEREVDQERAQLSATIDALQGKASLGNIVDEVMKVVRENGGDMGRNLGRTVRDNPLPALLAGVGLAWLMMGSGRPPERWDDEDERVYRRGHRDRTIPVGDRNAGSALLDAGEEMAGTHDAGTVYNADALGDDETGPGLRERATETMAEVGARASGAMSDMGARASDMAHAAGERISEAGHAVRHAGGAARHGLSRVRRRAVHAGSGARHGLDVLIEEQPLVLGALALAVGAAIGGALPSSRTEDRMFGARSDRAKETLRQVAGEEGRKLKATADAVVAEASAIVDETSAEVAEALPRRETIAEAAAGRVEDAATRLRDAAAEEAERQNLGGAMSGTSTEESESRDAGQPAEETGPDLDRPSSRP